MDVLLQEHDAKHIYKVPEGLRELCADISREVLRSQPENLYGFIAEYVDTLLITRENTKVAVKVVNNILLGSQAILSILYRSGFTLEQITLAAPRMQGAFRAFLDAVDTLPEQAAFRGHYERMILSEVKGRVQWQRAVANTLDILRKAGATQAEISKATKHIKFAYRGYYIRRNQRMDAPETEEELKKDARILEPAEAIQAVAWMEMMYNDSGLTMAKANEAARVIQRAYKQYRERKGSYDVQRLESTKSMIVQAVLDSLHQRVFQKVMSRDIPVEYGTQEELAITSTKVEMAFKERLRMSRLSMEGEEREEREEREESEKGDFDEGKGTEHEEEYEETEEMATTLPSPVSEYRPVESEAKTDAEYTEEQLTEAEMDEQQASEVEITTEQLPTSPEPQSEAETEYPTELETGAEGEGEEDEEKVTENKETEVHKHEAEEEEEEEPNVAQETGTADDAVE